MKEDQEEKGGQKEKEDHEAGRPPSTFGTPEEHVPEPPRSRATGMGEKEAGQDQKMKVGPKVHRLSRAPPKEKDLEKHPWPRTCWGELDHLLKFNKWR